MITALLLAIGSGLPLRVVGLPALAILVPEAATVAIAVLLLREARSLRRRRTTGDEVLCLLGIAAELRAGRTIRQAVPAAFERAPALDPGPLRRAVEAGLPPDRLAEALRSALPRHGRIAASAVRIGSPIGASMAEAFETAASLARSEEELEREKRAAAAQAVAGAAILVGLPASVAIQRVTSGALAGPGGALTTVGIAALAVGGIVIVAMLRRVLR